MAKIPGYFFIVLGIAGAIFFYTYTGTAIQSKELWIAFSLFFVIIGGFLLAKQKVESLGKKFRDSQHTSDADIRLNKKK